MDTHADLAFWTAGDDDSCASATMAAYREADEATLDRQQEILNNYALYGVRGAAIGHHVHEADERNLTRITENVVASAIDSWVAQCAQGKPRTMFLTVGGTWGDQRAAKNLTAHCDEKNRELGTRAIMEAALRDAGICGLGIIRAWADLHRERVSCERIHPLNIVIDDVSCVDTPPRTIFLRRYIDRRYLAQMYPKQADAIETAKGPDARFAITANIRADVVEVIEAWHLPSESNTSAGGEDANRVDTDGCHVVCIDGALLHKEPYTRESFPFVFIFALSSPRGFWGLPLVTRMGPLQFELNKLSRREQEAMQLVSVPRVYARKGDICGGKHINGVGHVVWTKSGQPPHFMTPPAVNQDVPARRAELRQSIFRVGGISEDFAASQKPAGLDSGRAQLVYLDTQTKRHVVAARSFEDARVALDRELVQCERELARLYEDRGEVYEVEFKSYGKLIKVPWSDINIDEDRLRIQTFPASALPTDPAARLQMLEQLLQSGRIDDEMFWSLADLPDFEGARDLATAPHQWIMWRMDELLTKGAAALPASAPPPYMDFGRAVKLIVHQLHAAAMNDAPEGGMKALRTWLAQVQAKSKEAEPEPAMAPPPAPMPPVPPGVDAGATPSALPAPGGPIPAGPPPAMPPMPPA